MSALTKHMTTSLTIKSEIDLSANSLSLERVREIRNAYLFAEAQGLPLNTFITINFREIQDESIWPADFERLSEQRKTEATQRAREKTVQSIRDWCDRQLPPVPFATVYALENNPKGGMGPHIHILMHLPVDRYAASLRSLENNIRKMMGWTTPELKKQLARLQAERQRLIASHKSASRVFMPYYTSVSEKSPGGPLSSEEQVVKLAYMAKGMQDTEVVTINGITRTLADHVTRGSQITLEPTGNVRASKRAGSLGLLAPSCREQQNWDESCADDMTWLDRKATLAAKERNVKNLLHQFHEKQRKPPVLPAQEPVDPHTYIMNLAAQHRIDSARSHAELKAFLDGVELGRPC